VSRYVRQAFVCEGTFAPGRWLSHPFEESRIADPCGYVEPPGTPQCGRGYHCPRCGGALLLQWVGATAVDIAEAWAERRHGRAPSSDATPTPTSREDP
jgi:hypothetical protein